MTVAATTDARPRRRWIWVVLGVLALAGVALLARARSHEDAAKPAGAAGPGGAAAGADRPVPVLIAPAVTKDVPIYLEGLGTVTAYKTVQVRSQVDGRLDKVIFREGQAVKHGEELATVDVRPFAIQLHTAEAAFARDKAQLEGAQRNLDRYEAVGGQRLLPQQQIDDQRALVEQLKGTVATDQASIENAKLQIDYAHIKSPIDGVTGVRQVDPGNIVHAADTTGIVVVTQMDPIAVIFTLPQDNLPDVSRQQTAGTPLAVEADSRDGSQVLATGTLELIDNQINQATATMRLKAIFPNPQRTLWPNQFVKARLRLTVRKGALVIPAAAVQRGPQGTFVFTVGDDDRAVMKPVTVERIEGEDALLSGGVQPGERVVREGQTQLRPGSKVSLRQAQGQGQGQPPAGSQGQTWAPGGHKPQPKP
jgi:multidrug efflux system membrane fusion protein